MSAYTCLWRYLVFSLLVIAAIEGVNSKMTTEEINSGIPQEKGIYRLTDETFDDFINWNKYAFVCFHGDNESLIAMITEYLSAVT